jgi:hypothetical protein
MANEMISKEFGKHKMAAVFANVPVENDLSGGISGGFAVVGYKGKTWSYRYRGEEKLLMREDGDGPRSSLDVVIVASSKVLSKVWYENGYVEGNSSPPDCWSGNGITPHANSPKKQSETCASCPRNVWGGRITENGKRAKECTDSKRMAVVPLDNVRNEDMGGPMLLRVPAASLSDLSTYGNELAKLGYHYFAVATKIQFDPEESYPKFRFIAIRPLDTEEGAAVLEMRDDALVGRILDEEGATVIDADGGVKPASVAALPPKTEAPKRTPPKTINAEPVTTKSKVTPRKAAVSRAEEIEDAQVVEEPAATPAAAEEAAEEEGGEEDEAFDAALEAKLSKFLGGKN